MTPEVEARERPPGIAPQLLAARAAQPRWAAAPLSSRARVIEAATRRLVAEAPALASAIGAASRRPLAEVWGAEIVPTLDALRWLARRGARCLAPRRLRRSRLQWYVRATRHRQVWEPHGVVGVVTPGNVLLYLSVPQIAAALLAGNAVVWKPAPSGAAVAFHAAALFHQAGLPPALLEVMTGGGGAARALVEAGVDKLFFTGGSEAGLELYRLQAARGRPAVLELSGRHVAVVLADADPEIAASGIVWSKLDNGGRNCVSAQIALVERAGLPAFLERARAAMEAGSRTERAPADEPRLDALVADAVARGARVVSGGRGQPTLLADVAAGMRVVDEEIQGPILAVVAIESEEQAVTWINRSAHRLSASLWTRDRAHARRLARRLDTGLVFINEELHPVAQPEVTLFGRGASGFGASRGRAGLMEMAQPKVISETPPGAARRHCGPTSPAAAGMFRATAELAVARGLGRRAAAAVALVRAVAALATRR